MTKKFVLSGISGKIFTNGSPAWVIFSIMGILVLSSCGPDYIFNETYTIRDQSWTYDDTVNFTLDVQDTTAIYNLSLEVRHSVDYPYQNLYTKFHTIFPGGQKREEVVSLELADKGAIWLGDCNQTTCLLSIPVQQGAYFNQAGQHQFLIEQFMRQDSLEGIISFGFTVVDTGNRRGTMGNEQ